MGCAAVMLCQAQFAVTQDKTAGPADATACTALWCSKTFVLYHAALVICPRLAGHAAGAFSINSSLSLSAPDRPLSVPWTWTRYCCRYNATNDNPCGTSITALSFSTPSRPSPVLRLLKVCVCVRVGGSGTQHRSTRAQARNLEVHEVAQQK